MLAAALIAGVAVVAIGHTVIAARQANQEARNKYLQDEIAKLEVQIGKINDIKQRTQSLLERKQVVETLQSDRTEVVHLFDEMIRRLPEGLYLKSFKQLGDTITIDGYTQSSARVSTLMRNLEESPWLEQAGLVEIKSATVNNLRANEFVLTVKQTPQQTEKAPVKGRKA
jgi:type IV pilus assembly protein PilN